MKIVTRKQLVDYIAKCKAADSAVTLFAGSRSHNFIKDRSFAQRDFIYIGKLIQYDGEGSSEFLVGKRNGVEDRLSLKDHNINEINDYNETYLFTTHEEAKEFVNHSGQKLYKIGTTYKWRDGDEIGECLYQNDKQGCFIGDEGLKVVHVSHLRDERVISI